MKSKMRHALGFASEARENADTQALLTCAEKEEENQEARTEARSHSWTGAPRCLCTVWAEAASLTGAGPGNPGGPHELGQLVTLKNYCYAQC